MTTLTIDYGTFRRASVNCSHHWIDDTAQAAADFVTRYEHSGGAMVFTADYPHYDATRDVITGWALRTASGTIIDVYATEDPEPLVRKEILLLTSHP